MPRNALALTLTGLLSACGTTVTSPIAVRPTPVSVPIVQPLSLAPVQWEVLPGTPPRFALSPESYQNLTLNLVDIRRFMEEQKAIIAMLRKVLDDRAGPQVEAPKDHQ